jgi:molybdenum cofactor cytidylyltransferase
VDAVVLAAGRSSRMGGPNKLMALFAGQPLVRLTTQSARASRAGAVVVVTGHQHDRVGDALSGIGVRLEHNREYASGLASSLKAGISALAPDADGALVMLGDMPGVTAADLDRLIAAFSKAGGQAIVRATHDGKRGNPVILPRAVFADVMKLEGDTGARHIVEAGDHATIDVELGGAASLDVDTPEAMELAGGVLQG